jgi:hypothetical protein
VVLAGPPLTTSTVKLTAPPTAGVVGTFVKAMPRSALGLGTTLAVAVLLALFGSVGVVAVIVAVRSYGPVGFTVAVTVSRTVALVGIAPIVHAPDVASYVPAPASGVLVVTV